MAVNGTELPIDQAFFEELYLMITEEANIPLRVLLLVQAEQRVNLDSFYDGIAQALQSCDIRRLSKAEQADLKGYFRRHVDVEHYDRIVFFLRFKQEIRQVRFIRSLPNLVILEHDAYQNYLPGNKYHGRFSRHYRALPWARIIVSGCGLARRLRSEGFDTAFVPKGYDQEILRNLGRRRDIELAFVGSTGHRAYSGRREFLEGLAERVDLKIMRVASGREYLETLNRIRFFVSCDKGFGEYMIKNAEAMACGCVLLAYDQGEEENGAMGFVDMENIVLYRDADELLHKLERLRAEPELADAIAAAGEALAVRRLTNRQLGAQVARALLPPLRQRRRRRWLGVFPAGYELARE